MRLRPLSNRIVVEPDPVEEMTKGGIYVPQTAQSQETIQTGVVKWRGPGKVSEFPVVVNPQDMRSLPAAPEFVRMKMHVQIGDRVMYGKYAGSQLQLERTKYVILKETEVLAVVEEDE